MLTRALDQLRAECHSARASRLFGALKGSLDAPEDALPLAALSCELGLEEGAVKVAAHRLRKRLGELVKEEIRQTVGSHADWQEELRELLDLTGR